MRKLKLFSRGIAKNFKFLVLKDNELVSYDMNLNRQDVNFHRATLLIAGGRIFYLVKTSIDTNRSILKSALADWSEESCI